MSAAESSVKELNSIGNVLAEMSVSVGELSKHISKLSISKPQTKPLILLDVNGLLCLKIKPNDPRYITTEKLSFPPYYDVIARPGIKELLAKLAEKYTLGIYSSTTYKNINEILGLLYGKDKRPFLFIADRELTKNDPDYGTDPTINEYDTIKVLSQIWENPTRNYKRIWNSSNTLLIDHELKKLRFNAEQNILIVDEFNPQTESPADLEKLIQMIDEKISSCTHADEPQPAGADIPGTPAKN